MRLLNRIRYAIGRIEKNVKNKCAVVRFKRGNASLLYRKKWRDKELGRTYSD